MDVKGMSTGEMDFYIRFFEGVVRRAPAFAEALSALGDMYTKKGLYAEGLEVDRKLAQLKPTDPVVFYNLACSYSLLNEIDQALASIRKAIENGYQDWDYLFEDQDLINLRNDIRFRDYLSKFLKSAEKNLKQSSD